MLARVIPPPCALCPRLLRALPGKMEAGVAFLVFVCFQLYHCGVYVCARRVSRRAEESRVQSALLLLLAWVLGWISLMKLTRQMH